MKHDLSGVCELGLQCGQVTVADEGLGLSQNPRPRHAVEDASTAVAPAHGEHGRNVGIGEGVLEIARSEIIPMVGLNWKDEDSAAMSWLSQLGDPYEVVAVDRDGEVAIDWGVYGAPETFLIDPSGIVIYKHVGPLNREIWQKQFLARLPSKGSGS